jgi:long-subunit fatty acid transport protein
MYRKLLFVLFSFLLPTLILAQSFQHPYSYYGIGELQNHNFIKCQSLGGLGYGWNDSISFSNTNPASYSNIRYSTFDIGIKGKLQGLEQDQNSEWTNYFSLAYAAFGFPISRKHNLGISFGLLPVSRVGYKTFSYFKTDSLNTKESFDIQGGLNKFYIGSSISIIKNLNLGFNIAYIFGNNTRDHSIEFINNTTFFGVKKITFKDYYGIGFDIGLQYKKSLTKDLQYTVGTAFSLPVDLSVNRENTTYSYRSVGVTKYIMDTIESFNGSENNLSIPFNFGLGGILQKNNIWKAGFDFKYEKWSDFVPENKEFILSDQWSFALGGEIIPKFDQNNYLQRIAYRGGIRYTNTFLNVYDEKFRKMSATIGFGFPISRNLSRINFAFEYGTIGKSAPNLIKENYFNFYLGFQLNDIWFIKPKYY